MQISAFLYQKSTPNLIFPPEPQDPSYYYDLKTHLDQNQDYRTSRIEWRKTRPDLKDMFRVKELFFQKFREEDLPTFHQDVFYFMRAHPELTPEDGARMFCGKWKGYEKTYGVEFVERAMRRCELCLSK